MIYIINQLNFSADITQQCGCWSAAQIICDECIVGPVIALYKPAAMSFGLSFLVDDLRLCNSKLVACDCDAECAQMLGIVFEEARILGLEIKYKLLASISPSNKTELLVFVLVQLEIVLILLLLVECQR